MPIHPSAYINPPVKRPVICTTPNSQIVKKRSSAHWRRVSNHRSSCTRYDCAGRQSYWHTGAEAHPKMLLIKRHNYARKNNSNMPMTLEPAVLMMWKKAFGRGRTTGKVFRVMLRQLYAGTNRGGFGADRGRCSKPASSGGVTVETIESCCYRSGLCECWRIDHQEVWIWVWRR